MAEPPFDPAHGVRFDLARGIVTRTRGSAPRVVVLPLGALAEIAQTVAAEAVAYAIGAALGERVGEAASADASVEAFASALAAELALAGLGTLRVERWGRAMVLATEGPVPEPMLAPLLEAAISVATARPVRCGALSREGATARVLVSNEAAIARVRAWIDGGVAWGDALTRLHAPPAGGDG